MVISSHHGNTSNDELDKSTVLSEEERASIITIKDDGDHQQRKENNDDLVVMTLTHYKQLEARMTEMESLLFRTITSTTTDNNNKSDSSSRNNNNNNENRKLRRMRSLTITTNTLRSDDDGSADLDNLLRELPSDACSFLIVEKPCSVPFVFGISVAMLQTCAYLSVFFNMIGVSSDLFLFHIPVNVLQEVRFTQLIALLISVLTQGSIRTCFHMMVYGYDEQSIREGFPKVTKWKWNLSIVIRFVIGSLSLVVMFFLIITADSVIGLLLNFTAMEFVSQLDVVCFCMAHERYLGQAAFRQSHAITDTSYRTKMAGRDNWFIQSLHVMLFVTIFLAMLIGWIIVARSQASGKYLCSTILVQFDDASIPFLGVFSGLYDAQSVEMDFFSPNRVEYVERRRPTQRPRAKFAYCENSQAWTFVWDEETNRDLDPCNWRIRSKETVGFDVTEMMSSQWIVRDMQNRQIPMKYFYLACVDCDRTSNEYQCSGYGSCHNAVCSCDGGRYGLRCQHQEACPKIGFDARFGKFLTNQGWAETFDRFDLQNEIINSYGRPVYIQEYSPGQFDIIMFVGRRWAATKSYFLPFDQYNRNDQNTTTKEAIATFFLRDFHGLWSNVTFLVISDPVDISTPQDRGDPIGIGWYRNVVTDRGQQQVAVSNEPLSSVFLCDVCNNVTNPCMYGVCVDDGNCRCTDGSLGTLCQIPPIGNGHCDLFFNTLSFEHDGGDCCESTCVSSTDFICGTEGFSNVGYFFCNLPADGWRVSSNTLSGKYGSVSGYAVALSGNGQILAVASARVGTVRLFDRDGSQWIQRGNELRGNADIYFGNSLAVTEGYWGLVRNAMSMVPVVLVIGTTSTRKGYIYVYECDVFDCIQQPRELVAFKYKNPMKLVLDMSGDGQFIFVGVAPIKDADFVKFPYPRIICYERSSLDSEWIRREPDFNLGDTEGVYSVSSSRSGDVLVVGSYTTGISEQGAQFIQKDMKRVFVRTGKIWELWWETESEAHPAMLSNMQGRSMAISSHGKVFASGLWSSSETVADDENQKQGVRIVRWDEGESDWLQQGSIIGCGDGLELQGWSVSISADGSIIAIAAAERNDENSVMPGVKLNGTVCTFHWNGIEWDRLPGVYIQGGHSSSVALSATGSLLAVGLPFHDISREGLTSVYEFPRVNPLNGTAVLRVSLTTDDKPQSTNWEVFSNATSQIILKGGPYDAKLFLSTFVEETIVSIDDCLIFTIYDNLDLNSELLPNGMKPPGRHALYMDGKQVVLGAVTNAVERVYIGSNCLECPPGTTLFQMFIQTCIPIAWELMDRSSGKTQFSSNNFGNYPGGKINNCTFSNQSTIWEELCLSPEKDCSVFSLRLLDIRMDLPIDVQSEEEIEPKLLQYGLLMNHTEIVRNTISASTQDKKKNQFLLEKYIGSCVP